jgi:hypothetical protein
MLTIGYRQSALAAARCCQDCDYCEDGMYESCERSEECKRQGVPFSERTASYELKEINIEAKAQEKNQYTSAGIKLLSKRVFEGATPGHILAMETKNSDIDFFFLVRVLEKIEKLGSGEAFDFEDCGVSICGASGALRH